MLSGCSHALSCCRGILQVMCSLSTFRITSSRYLQHTCRQFRDVWSMFRVCWALPRTVPTEPVQTPRTPLVESRTSCQQLVRIVKDHQISVINSHQFMHCLLLISVVMVDVSWWRNSQTKLWLQLLCGAGRTHLHTPYAALALLGAYWQLRGSPCKGCKIDQD